MTRNLEGAHLGPYEVQGLLGRGGMAQVYQGYDPRLDRQVAIKVLSESAMLEDGIAERFDHEARLLANLRHPHVVSVYDLGKEDGLLYMVQELLPGPTLESWMQAHAIPNEPPTRAEILQIIEQLASGLAAIHQAGIIHRDVKPANAMWNRTGALVLTDFGIAKQTRKDAGLTQAGIVMGTPAYLSPEQAWGLPLTPASDIYALGIILYELLSGHPPFQGDTPMGTVMQHIQAPLPRLHPRVPDVPLAVATVVEQALAKEPEARFARATDLSATLSAAWSLAGAPERPDDQATRAWQQEGAAPAPTPIQSEAESGATRSWSAPATGAPSTAPAAEDDEATRAWQQEGVNPGTPAVASPAPERRPLVLPPAPARSAWSLGLPLAVGLLLLLAAGWAIQALQNRDDGAGSGAALPTVPVEASVPAPAAGEPSLPVPTSQPETLPTGAPQDPLLQALAFLEASEASGQLGNQGRKLLTTLAEVQQHLAEGNTGEAATNLREARSTLAAQAQAGRIDGAVAEEAIQLLDAAALHYGLNLAEETDEKDKDKDEDKDKDKDKDK